MTPKHSPGPWRVNWGQVLDVNGLVVADFGHRTAEMEFGKDQVLAPDARLIAAASELLEALKRRVANCSIGPAGPECKCLDCEMDLALIRRIEGEE